MKTNLVLEVKKVRYVKGGLIEAEVYPWPGYRSAIEIDLPIENGMAVYKETLDDYRKDFEGKSFAEIFDDIIMMTLETLESMIRDAIETNPEVRCDESTYPINGRSFHETTYYIKDDEDKVLYDADEHER